MNPASASTEPLYSCLGADPDLGEIVDLFVNEMPGRIAALEDLLANSDWEGLRRAAHQLKGSAGSYGFDPISPCAAVLEEAVRNGQPEQQVHRCTADLVDMCRRARGGAPQ